MLQRLLVEVPKHFWVAAAGSIPPQRQRLCNGLELKCRAIRRRMFLPKNGTQGDRMTQTEGIKGVGGEVNHTLSDFTQATELTVFSHNSTVHRSSPSHDFNTGVGHPRGYHQKIYVIYASVRGTRPSTDLRLMPAKTVSPT